MGKFAKRSRQLGRRPPLQNRTNIRAIFRDMENPVTSAHSSMPPLQVGMLVYQRMTLLDLAGPQSALGFHGRTYLVAKTLDPIMTDLGVSIIPTTIYADCPRDLDVLFVPGGQGTTEVMQDADALAFLADRGKSARYVTSVCTGSIVLAAAGLLDGYRAACHWAFCAQLEATGNVEAIGERVVTDRNRITGGGVTAGLDFGLRLLAELRGEKVAKMTQLLLEYDPKPPFSAGTPEFAGTELTAMATGLLQDGLDRGMEIANKSFEDRRSAASTS